MAMGIAVTGWDINMDTGMGTGMDIGTTVGLCGTITIIMDHDTTGGQAMEPFHQALVIIPVIPVALLAEGLLLRSISELQQKV